MDIKKECLSNRTLLLQFINVAPQQSANDTKIRFLSVNNSWKDCELTTANKRTNN